MLLTCLQCQRVFPQIVIGEVEAGGYMLCTVCGHVMCWTEDFSLRELTDDDRMDAARNFELMRERNNVLSKLLPSRGIKYPVSSVILTCVVTLMLVMVVLERVGIVPLLHQK